MAGTVALVEALKRALKSKGLTYADVARHLGMSEASVKRMFSRRDFTLKRLERVCQHAGLEISDLVRSSEGEAHYVSQLTREQEKELVADQKLLLVAVCALNHVPFEEIVATYELSNAECVRLLVRLDRLGIVDFLPGNRIKPRISRTFAWIPEGPIQTFFKAQAAKEYFNATFDKPGELMLFVNGMLSKGSTAAIIARLKRVAAEFADLHNEDLRLPYGERWAHSLLVAMRPWEAGVFKHLRRKPT
jgi:transcriptional regulator with XRE-family HTH domain